MRKRNRLVGIIMTIAMMVALLPATAFAAEGELWVGGEQMTGNNSVSSGGGTATYNSETNTLTLDNFSYTGEGYTFDSTNDKSAAIYSTLGALNIVLKGENSISHNKTCKESYGIYTKGDLVISTEDTGKLTASAGAVSDISHGIWSFNGNITVSENTELNGIGGEANISRGICAFGQIISNGGTIEGTAGKGGSISHGISAGSIKSNNANSKITGTAGSAKESAGIRLWDNTTFEKGYMKGVGGDIDENDPTAVDYKSYGIFVDENDKLTVGSGATVIARGETAAFNLNSVDPAVDYSRKEIHIGDANSGGQGEAIPAPDSSPNTGDNSNMILWLALLLVSGGAIIVAVVLGRKRK